MAQTSTTWSNDSLSSVDGLANPAVVNGVSDSSPTARSALNQQANGVSTGGAQSKDLNGAKPPSSSNEIGGSTMTRKRSRSGTRKHSRMIPPPAGGDKRKHGGQEDGLDMSTVRMNSYIKGDQLYRAAALEQEVKVTEFVANQRHDRILNLKLRGIDIDPQMEAQLEHGTSHYPLRTLVKPEEIYGIGYGQYGTVPHTAPGNQPGIVYPSRRGRIGGRKAREIRPSRSDLQRHADQIEELVPIRLDIEWEKVRLRDTFTWNLHDRMVPVDVFAEQLVEDFGLSLDSCRGLVQQVKAHMEEQIQEYMPHAFLDDGPEDPHLPYTAYKDDEMRITVKLNITIGQYTLVDQFEWDINNSVDAPELFARQMAKDMSLSGEFVTAIAHDIREQCQLFTKSLYIVGHSFDGKPVMDQDLQGAMMPSPLASTFRPYQATKEYMPWLYELNDVDLERTELSLSREERRQKRSVNRRGGPALPDLKDRRRTIRTLVVSSIIPGAADNLEDSRVFKRVVTATGKSKRPGYKDRDSLDGSEDSTSEDSSPGSPVIPQHLISGTTRTRGMRGAAREAQAAMKGALARSATPESVNLHHHETRTGRRRDYREESPDEGPTSLIVKLKIPPARLRALQRDQRAKVKGDHARSLSATPGRGTPKLGHMGPPSTPGAARSSPSHHHRDVNPLHPHAAQLGRVDALGPASDEHPVVRSPLGPPSYSRLHLLPFHSPSPLPCSHCTDRPPAPLPGMAPEIAAQAARELQERQFRGPDALHRRLALDRPPHRQHAFQQDGARVHGPGGHQVHVLPAHQVPGLSRQDVHTWSRNRGHEL